MILAKTPAFLMDLAVNNNREWFNENKSTYLEAKEEFENFVGVLIQQIQEFDSSIKNLNPKDCVFRIYKDTRFSKDKTPYKNHFGGYVTKDGRKGKFGGYYIHIEPDNSFVAGGLHNLEGPDLLKVRTAIFEDANTYKQIIEHKDFIDSFGEIRGDKLKTTPKGFPKDFENINLIRNKAFYVIHNISDDTVSSDDLIPTMLKAFQRMKPLNDYFNAIIE